MDTQCRPSIDHLYFDNTFGAVDGIPVPQELAEKAWLATWQTLCPKDGANTAGWEASLILADDDHVRSLNKQFRGKDTPTNVLSFPDGDIPMGEDTLPLGDIIIAIPTVLREAAEQHKIPQNHLCHLMVHGLLHLCGFDHMTDEEATVMEDAEIRILNTLNIPNPYEEQNHHE